ncbi:MAG: AmpG family muropeptide MFS transporter [Rhodospirillales bacterium]|nr:AmpG family muropeptide MFS transporter [Rhodospirillales bacterium]
MRSVAAALGDRNVLIVLLQGFSSGLPLALTGATLAFWLTEAGVSLKTIGFATLIGTAYVFKFLWAPLVDRLPLPILTQRLGQRRGWALLVQVLLACAIFAVGRTDPATGLALTVAAAVCVAFLSATQDIIIDAMRIEILKPEQQGIGAAATQWGYRGGMLASGAGALYAASFGGWAAAYTIMALLMGVGIVSVLMMQEPNRPQDKTPPQSVGAWIDTAVVGPFRDMMLRDGWWLILIVVVLYKFGDALAGVMTSPFYVQTGFSKIEIANISKVFGVIATLAGVAAGGALILRVGLYPGLLVAGVLQMLSNLMYVLLAVAGYNLTILTATIGIENFTGGMGSAAFVAYLSLLCNARFTATQYALLSALAAVPQRILSAWGGVLAEALGWAPFFVVSTAAALPGLLLLVYLMRRFPLTDKSA